jgi:hypothetical protein
MLNRDSCALPSSYAGSKGAAWLIGAFLICPCHLPLTMAFASMVLAGTAAGVLLRAHPLVAGTLITLVWLAASWHGIRLMGRPSRGRLGP